MTLNFASLWQLYGDKQHTPIAEHKFHPTRNWRFDWAFPREMVAVEIEGGGYVRGRHHRQKGYQEDCEKYRAAVLAGWRLLRYTTQDLTKRPAQCVEEIVALITRAEIDVEEIA